MPADVAITALGAPQARPATPAQSLHGAATQDAAAAPAATKRPLVNPSLHVDLALNLVVLQFVDDKGDVTQSIPSEKQLKAYREQAESAPARPSAEKAGTAAET